MKLHSNNTKTSSAKRAVSLFGVGLATAAVSFAGVFQALAA